MSEQTVPVVDSATDKGDVEQQYDPSQSDDAKNSQTEQSGPAQTTAPMTGSKGQLTDDETLVECPKCHGEGKINLTAADQIELNRKQSHEQNMKLAHGLTDPNELQAKKQQEMIDAGVTMMGAAQQGGNALGPGNVDESAQGYQWPRSQADAPVQMQQFNPEDPAHPEKHGSFAEEQPGDNWVPADSYGSPKSSEWMKRQEAIEQARSSGGPDQNEIATGKNEEEHPAGYAGLQRSADEERLAKEQNNPQQGLATPDTAYNESGGGPKK